jgi:hypothetical protein
METGNHTQKGVTYVKISIGTSICLAAISSFMCTTPAFANRIDAEKDGVKLSAWPTYTQNSLISITVVIENTNQHSVRNINYEVTFTCGKETETASPHGGNYASQSDPWPSLPANDKVGLEIEHCANDFSEVSINSASISSFDQDAPDSFHDFESRTKETTLSNRGSSVESALRDCVTYTRKELDFPLPSSYNAQEWRDNSPNCAYNGDYPYYDIKLPLPGRSVTENFDQGGLSFVKQDIATRVATAFNHAIELCGGKKEPF